MAWDVYARVAARLRHHRYAAAADPLGRSPSIAAIIAEGRRRTTLLSMTLGAALAIGIGSGWMQATGHWVAPASLRPLKAAVDATGVDIVRLSTADLTMRLGTPAEVIGVLVELKGRGDFEYLERLTLWLSSLPSNNRPEIANNLASLANTGVDHGARYAMTQVLLGLGVDVIEEINFLNAERPNFFTALAKIPREARLGVFDAGFPVRPVDETRAQLWSVINDLRFPADDLVRPLAEVARLDHVRLEMVRRWASKPGPLPSCAPVACYDPQLMCPRGAHPVCQRDR